MVSVTSASRYVTSASHYHPRSDSVELTETVPIASVSYHLHQTVYICTSRLLGTLKSSAKSKATIKLKIETV